MCLSGIVHFSAGLRASLSCGSTFRWDVDELVDMQSDGGDNQDHGESSG